VDLPIRKTLPHAIPQWVAEGSWFFITINCVPPGKNQPCHADTGDAVLTAVKFNHERLVWHCRLCLLMPDRLHAIIAFPREPGMENTVKNWKKFVAGKHGVDWQRDFFRSPLARSSRTGRENQSHRDESCSQRIVRASRGLGMGLSPERPAATALVGRAVLYPMFIRVYGGAHSPRRASCMTRPTLPLRV
jgi:hypothetical protein